MFPFRPGAPASLPPTMTARRSTDPSRLFPTPDSCPMRFAILAVGCILAGCTRYEYRLPETGATLEGTVTYGGETLQMAQINVLGEKSQGIGEIQNGRYKVENV